VLFFVSLLQLISNETKQQEPEQQQQQQEQQNLFERIVDARCTMNNDVRETKYDGGPTVESQFGIAYVGCINILWNVGI
jgi:hypothetical protein